MEILQLLVAAPSLETTSWHIARNFLAHALAASWAFLLAKMDLILEVYAVFHNGLLFFFYAFQHMLNVKFWRSSFDPELIQTCAYYFRKASASCKCAFGACEDAANLSPSNRTTSSGTPKSAKFWWSIFDPGIDSDMRLLLSQSVQCVRGRSPPFAIQQDYFLWHSKECEILVEYFRPRN